MVVALELSADEVRVLQQTAQAAGTTVEAVLHALIAQMSPQVPPPAEAPPSPDAETAAGDAESRAERRREQEEIAANIRRWHQEQARPE